MEYYRASNLNKTRLRQLMDALETATSSYAKHVKYEEPIGHPKKFIFQASDNFFDNWMADTGITLEKGSEAIIPIPLPPSPKLIDSEKGTEFYLLKLGRKKTKVATRKVIWYLMSNRGNGSIIFLDQKEKEKQLSFSLFEKKEIDLIKGLVKEGYEVHYSTILWEPYLP